MERDATVEKFRDFVVAEGETLGRLLSWAERHVLEKTLSRLGGDGGELTLAQISFLQQLCLGSTRLTDLAGRMGMTKQAAGQIVDALERKGIVRRIPDPTDGRAKVIEHTPIGFAMIGRLIDATLEAEREVAQAVGRRDLARLKAILARVAAEGESRPR